MRMRVTICIVIIQLCGHSVHNTTQIETGDRQEGQAGGEGSSLERGGADQGPVPPQAESGGDQCRLEAGGRFLKEAPH